MKSIKSAIFFKCLLFTSIVFASCSNSSGPSEKPGDKENELVSFTIEGPSESLVSIDKQQKTIRLLFPFLCDINLENLIINFTIPLKAESNLVSGNSYNFTSPQELIITSKSGLENVYEISAEVCSGTAVIISDTQNDIIPLYNQGEFFENINMVIDKAHDAAVPAYYIMLRALIVNGDSSAWKLPSQLSVYDDAILVPKANIFNAFDNSTVLHQSLMKRGIGKVIIVGVSSMGCVIGTCRGTASLKYEVTLISDAHGEPIGYRPVTAVAQCNTTFINEKLGRIITAAQLSF